MKRYFFLINVLVFFLTIFLTQAQSDPLQLIWQWQPSNPEPIYEKLYKRSNLIIMNYHDPSKQILIDLTDGHVICEYPNMTCNSSGSRFFVHDFKIPRTSAYDRNTLEYLGEVLPNIPYVFAPDDSTVVTLTDTNHILQFWNIYTRELVESIKLPNTPFSPKYSLGVQREFSYDGRFLAFVLSQRDKPFQSNFIIYDRKERKFMYQINLGDDWFYTFDFFNTQNKIVYGETVQLDGDDKPYSYLRIYDLEKQSIERSVKIGTSDKPFSTAFLRNDDKIIVYYLKEIEGPTRFYDYENNKILDLQLTKHISHLKDSAVYGFEPPQAWRLDWTVGIEDNNVENTVTFLYPNPTSGNINLDIEPNLYHGQWQITDMSGRVILYGIILPNQQLQINLGALPAQNYLLRIQNGSNTLTYKVQKIYEM